MCVCVGPRILGMKQRCPLLLPTHLLLLFHSYDPVTGSRPQVEKAHTDPVLGRGVKGDTIVDLDESDEGSLECSLSRQP